MSYANGRTLFDADSHIMELPDFLTLHADPDMRDRLPPIDYTRSSMEEADGWALARAGGHARSYANELEALGGDGLIRGPKEEKALGAFDSADRTRALDLLGFERQLVFSTLSGTVVFDPPPDQGCPNADIRQTEAISQQFEHGRMLWLASSMSPSPLMKML